MARDYSYDDWGVETEPFPAPPANAPEARESSGGTYTLKQIFDYFGIPTTPVFLSWLQASGNDVQIVQRLGGKSLEDVFEPEDFKSWLQLWVDKAPSALEVTPTPKPGEGNDVVTSGKGGGTVTKTTRTPEEWEANAEFQTWFKQQYPQDIWEPDTWFNTQNAFMLDRTRKDYQTWKSQPTKTTVTGQTIPKTAAEWRAWFETLTAGKTPNSATLLELEPQLTAMGIKLFKNAAGIAHKIQLPDGSIYDVGFQFSGKDESIRKWQWSLVSGEPDYQEPYTGQYTSPPGWTPPPFDQTVYEPPPAPGFTPPSYAAPAPLETPSPLFAPPPFEYESYPAAAPFSYADWEAPAPFQAPTAESVMADPGLQLRIKEAQDALQHSAAAKGTLLSGGTLEDLIKYSQSLAAQEYGQAFGRAKDTYGMNYQSAWDEYMQNYGKAASSYATNEAARAGAYDRSRGNAYQNYLANYGISSDVYGKNYDVTSDVYKTNVGVGEGAYDRAYQSALASFAPKMQEWQTRAGLGAQQSQDIYNRAWDEYLASYNIFKENQDRPFAKFYDLTRLGVT